MKTIYGTTFILFLILCLPSCQDQQNIPQANEPGIASKLPDFTLTDLGNGLVRAERKEETTGRLLEEGYLLNGKKTGAWVIYHDTGEENRIKYITSFVNGQKTGPALEISYRCQLIQQEHYTADLPNSVWIKYRNSRMEEETNYQDGQLHGPFKTFFRDGKLRQSGNYVNGELDGFVRYYNEEGKVTLEYEYQNGKKIRGGLKE